MESEKEKRMNKFAKFLPAVMLANLNGTAQQPPTSAYEFRPVFTAATNIGGHALTVRQKVEGIALNDNGEVAAVFHWNEGDRQHSAVITSRRVVARDGDVLGGKSIASINATSLSLSASGQVAFEAVYGSPSQTGIFVERKFIEALSVSGSPDDFTLSDDGKVTLKAAVAAAATPAAPSGSALSASPWSRVLQNAVRLKVPRSIGGVIRNKAESVSMWTTHSQRQDAAHRPRSHSSRSA
jgi:hypothetical protein